MESEVEGELPLLLLLLLLPPLLEELKVNMEDEEPLDFSSLGLLDELLVLEPDDLEEEFWFPKFEPKTLEVHKISSLHSQYLWLIFWERAQRSHL